MKDWNLHALTEFLLDYEAAGRLDVLKIDAPKRGLETRDDLHEFFGIALVDLDVEYIDAGELLEQACLAFHHWLPREWSDVSEPEHGAAVRHDRYEVGARREIARLQRIFGYRSAGGGDARGVGKSQIALIGQSFRREDGDFSRSGKAMIVKCASNELLIHGTPSSQLLDVLLIDGSARLECKGRRMKPA